MSNIYKDYEAPTAAGAFLKLEDGKPVKIRIASEPYIFQDLYKGPEGERLSVRYAWVVYNFTAEMAQILQLPVTGFRAVQAIAADDDWGAPTEYNLTVKRSGTGKQTEYSVTPTPNRTPLTAEQTEAVAAVDLQAAIKNAITLVEAHNGKPLPKAVPREAEAPVPKEAKGREVVIQDLDETEKINLDEVPW